MAAFDVNLDHEDTKHSRVGRQADVPPKRLLTFPDAKITAIRLNAVSKDVSYQDDGTIKALRGKDLDLTVYGIGLTNETLVKLTTAQAEFGQPCKSDNYHVQTRAFDIEVNEDGTSARLELLGERVDQTDGVFFFCVRSDDSTDYIHQGTGRYVSIDIYQMLLPLWIMVVFIVVLLSLSGLFSGLNLGLMALDQTELKIVQNTGSPKEKGYANKIAPIRAHGNFLLCSLLLGNVLVNNTLTILLDTLTSGLVAVIGATMGIVVFGEIIPQAICSRHGLAVGAYTILLTKFFMVVTFPLSYPISKLLDVVLGAEIGTVYNKIKLIELLRVTNESNDLEKEEVDIVTGALVYKDKTVRDVMTKLDDVFMLPTTAVLDFDTVSQIREHGYSRIPVYEGGDSKNIVHILFAKDLMFVDPDDKMPLTMLCEFYNNEVNFVFHDTPLNVMFNDFKSGDKGHMAFVKEINNEGDGDPFYETIGLVTLEDIIEEIIQQEIVDETDVILDNRTKKRRKKEWKAMDGGFPISAEDPKRKTYVSPQLVLAVFQYLATSIEPFKGPYIMDSVLKKLLSLDIFREIKIKKEKSRRPEDELVIIQKGQPIDFFILIVEGRVEVNIGREELVFESGPFTYFGIQVLTQILQEPPKASPALNRAMHTSLSHSDNVASSIRASIRKASTSAASVIDITNKSDVGRRNTMANVSAATITEGVATPVGALASSRHGSSNLNSQNNNVQAPFVPDYTVKAVSDVLYLRIKKSLFLAAAKATAMTNKAISSGGTHGDVNENALDHYLESVNEDDGAFDHDIMMVRNPSVRSPDKVIEALARQVTPSIDRKQVLEDKPLIIKKVATTDNHVANEGSSALNAKPSSGVKEFWGDSSTFSDSKEDKADEYDLDSDSLPFIDKTAMSDVSGGGPGNNGPNSLPSAGEVASTAGDTTHSKDNNSGET
eukprot:TCALIF_02895-PA protein Name:"Similar to CNNM2 Metal transporter CNNM2 (Homo sapiens)" AED:0.03 eAED:0.03 QI:0/0/0/0.5/1/1/2/0/940